MQELDITKIKPMNDQAITYVKNRIKFNEELLAKKSNPNTVVMLENAITELKGVLEILEVYPSMTSQEVKFAEG